MSRRVLLGVAGVAIALLASAPAASAATVRYASPAGSGTGLCTSPDPMAVDPPCNLTRAVEMVAQNGDEVIVNPGTYNADIDIASAIFLHGVAGQARPEIVGPQAGLEATDAGASGSSVTYLGLTGPIGIRIAVNATIDRVIARGTFADGCFVNPAGTSSINLYNSTCIGATNNRGVDLQATGIVDTLLLRNVTAFAPGASGNGILVSALDNATTLTVEAHNVIAEGATDVSTQGPGEANGALSFSNYASIFENAATGTVTDPTTMSNQMTPPVFADADLHQAASSPTINAGNDADTSGLLDVDGDMRTVGTSSDIGADEFVPSPAVPAVQSNGFTVGPVKGKKLTLTLDSAGAVEVADGGGKKLKPSSATGGPGAVEVTLKLSKAAKQRLKLKGKVTVQARITFTPTGDVANSVTQKLKIKGK